MSPVRPEQASVLVHHSWYSSRVGTAHARSTGAMGAAPAIVQFVGGTPADAIRFTNRMYEITLAENSAFTVPTLGFRGSPTGIDLRKVVELGELPVINTGIAHREPGVGMVGAGLVRPPRECFAQALLACAETFAP
jgi:hypothetical protein